MATHTFRMYNREFTIEANDPVLEADYARGQFYEGMMLDWILANVPRGGIWVDCGANIGNHSLAFSVVADLVMAFEPVPQNFDKLKRNTSTRTIIPIMLGVGQGPRLMGVEETAQGRDSQFALVDNDSPYVPVVSLDAIVPNARLLKIDVEGMEYETLMGARRILQDDHPEIFVEIWNKVDLDLITKLLGVYGYILIERWNEAPTYHFSASGRYPVTYKPPVE